MTWQKKVDNFKSEARKRLSDMIEISDLERGSTLDCGKVKGTSACHNIGVLFKIGGERFQSAICDIKGPPKGGQKEAKRTPPGLPLPFPVPPANFPRNHLLKPYIPNGLTPTGTPLNGTRRHSVCLGEPDSLIEELMEERENVMDKIRDVVRLTKNQDGQEDASLEGSMLNEHMGDDITHGCYGENCYKHCVLCDVHLSGIPPLNAHRISQRHQKKVQQRKMQGLAAKKSTPAACGGPDGDDRMGPCGAIACTHHCKVCNKCMTGATPAKQHLDSDKHKRKESVTLGRPRNDFVNRLSFSGMEGPSLDYSIGSEGCSKSRCIIHCNCCDKCFNGEYSWMQHRESGEHSRTLAILLDKPNSDRSIGTMSLQSTTSQIDSLAWDGFEVGASVPDVIEMNVCLATGCLYHCKCCDKHLSGREPMQQHASSVKHISMAQVYQRAGSSRSSGSDNGADVDSLSAELEELEVGDKIEEIVPPCGKIGCAFHCSLCDTCLSGVVPKNQHVASKNHSQIRQRLAQMSQPSTQKSVTPIGAATGVSNLLSDYSNDFTQCNQPGCAYHCQVCNLHLTGSEPMKQHMVSKNHEKQKQAALRIQPQMVNGYLSPRSPGGNGNQDYSQQDCTYPGCNYHCIICDLHLSGQDPMRQHMESAKHLKKKQAFENIERSRRPILGASTSIPMTGSLFPRGAPPGSHQPNPIGFERSQSDKNPFSVGTNGPTALTYQEVNKVTGDEESEIFGLCPLGAPGCLFHCHPCSLHLNSVGPKQQHETSSKHLKMVRSYLAEKGVMSPSELQRMNKDAAEFFQRITTSPTRVTSPAAGQSPRARQGAPRNSDGTLTVFAPCPEESRVCMIHCLACNKHFNESLPKQQHESSSKHLKAAQRYLAGVTTKPTEQDDAFIVQSGGNSDLMLKTQLKTSKSSTSLSGLPKWMAEERKLPPVEKTAPANETYQPLTKTVPRNYQMELYRKAMSEDTVCFLPTGTGKTLVSALVIDHMLEMNPTRPVLFLVEKILLVIQQTKYLRNELGEKQYKRWNPRTKKTEQRHLNVAGLCSGHVDSTGNSVLQELDVVVATAGFFLNLLSKDWIKWQDFCLVVVDEVHHCTKRHVFNELMKEHHEPLNTSQRPKLFGMTASPAGEATVPFTQEKLMELLRNIGGAKLSIVEDHEEQLREFQSRTELKVELAQMSPEENELEDDILMYLVHIFNFLVKTTNLGTLCPEMGLSVKDGQGAMLNALEMAGEGLEAFRNLLKMIEVKERCKNMGSFIRKIISHADTVCEAVLGLRLCGEEAAYYALKPLTDTSNSCGFGEMEKVGFSCDGLLSRAGSYEQNAEEGRKKMTAFWHLVNKIARTVDWGAAETKPIVMVIVRERKFAKLLATLLQDEACVRDLGLNVQYIVGHGDGEVGMSVSKQRRLLEETWEHKYQVLVATSVAEEGLDLPECELVIEMDPPGNVTSLVQIRGRARKQCSHLVAVCRTEAQVERIRQLEEKECCMMQAARAIVGQQRIKTASSPFVWSL